MAKDLKVSRKEFWDERYIQGSMPWDIGQVAPAFIKYFNENLLLNAKKVAVLGCGLGHDAFFLATYKERNFEVFGFDFADSAIKFCNGLKEKNNLSNISFYQTNFFELTKDAKWKNNFDYVIEHTSLCAIDPEFRKEYVSLIKYLLKPNGKLIGLFFIKPIELGGPPFGSTSEEIRELFTKDFTEVEKLHPEECLHKEKLQGNEYFGVFRKKE
ncbi:MAG: methyltransferase domain-containing protein [Candidatus Melainabacteria bacterium]|nr:methyltransferase domain-containing protein [Candidatus Melainabacteria bacterium]